MKNGTLDSRVTFQRYTANDSFDGAGSGDWVDQVTIWARVLDVLPSSAEKDVEIATVARSEADVAIRYRDDITGDMRVLIKGRIYEIIRGPAEFGRRDELRMRVAEFSPAGGGR